MSEFLASVRERQKSPEAIAHRVALFLGDAAKRAIILEAGDDVIFYSALLKRSGATSRPEFFSADGRARVVKALEILKDLGKSERSFGIIDRDFHFDDPEISEDGRILTIEFYSFENYFGNYELISEVGKNFFALEAGSDSLAAWSSATAMFMERIPDCLLEEHSAAAWARMNNRRCLLSNFPVTSCVHFDRNGSLSKSNATFERFILDTELDISDYVASERQIYMADIASRDWRARFRGHYFWKLFVNFLNAFRAWLDEENRASGRNRSRTRAEISERHAIESATSFIDVPPVVEKFFLKLAA